jgi:hypothetical protein
MLTDKARTGVMSLGSCCALTRTPRLTARKRVPAATWSSVWYLLSSFAVISYTENWAYVAFAAIGSWVGAYATITDHFPASPAGRPSGGAAPE